MFRDDPCLRSAQALAQRLLDGSALARAPKLGTQSPIGSASSSATPKSPSSPTGRCRSASQGHLHGVPDDEVRKCCRIISQSRQRGARAELADRQHRRQIDPVRYRHGHLEGVRADHRPAAEEHGREPASSPATSTPWCCRTPISITSAASSAPDDKPLFPNAQYYIAQSDFDF